VESATANVPVRPRELRAAARTTLPLIIWLAIIAVSFVWGTAINAAGGRIGLNAPPLHGAWTLSITPQLAIPVLLGGLGVAFGPALSRSLGWRHLLLAAATGSLLWSLALAFTAGTGGVFDPLTRPSEYLAGLAFIDSPGDYLASFTDRVDAYPTHVRGHPPGFVLGLWALGEVGLGGAEIASLIVIAVGASGIAATLVAARAVAGEEWARRAAPFLVLAPAAAWIATSADAFYMGVGAWAVALTVLAIEAEGRRATALAIGGGLVFAVCAFLSYGLVLLGIVPAAVALERRRPRPILMVAQVVSAVVAVVWLTTGFWWFEGLVEVREQYLAGIAPSRPYDFFLLANLAAFAVAAGPALAVALGRAKINAAWALPLGGLAAVVVADLSGMSKAEVERIWLPFLPWALLATGALTSERGARTLLAAGAGLAIAIHVAVDLPW
jgi:methylthioxylose transferase